MTSVADFLCKLPVTKQGNYFGTRYRFMVKGVTPKFRAELTVHWRKTYEHFNATFGASYWFSSATQAIDIQKMKTDGSIELKIVSGAVDDKNETLLHNFRKPSECEDKWNGNVFS